MTVSERPGATTRVGFGAGSRPMRCCVGITLLAMACAPEPQVEAASFWSALEAGDVEAAAALSNAKDAREVESVLLGRTVTGVRFEEPVVVEGTAHIPTVLEIEDLDAPLRFETYLLRRDGSGVFEEGEWLVDLRPTARAVHSAEVRVLFESAAEVVREGAAALSEAFEQGAREAAREIERTLRELQLDFENDSLDSSPRSQPDAAPDAPAGS